MKKCFASVGFLLIRTVPVVLLRCAPQKGVRARR